ncbi:sensor domain-containing diguanylate cyclase [Mycobacteroides abscessus]|nr:sensor domain-containing diguanylate cyclase [Mycobacteroides abscessus]
MPSRYELMVSYLRTRSLIPLLRIVVGGCAGTLAVVPLAMQFSPLGPQGPVWRTVGLVVGLIALFWMLRWWLGPLPTERTSMTFSVMSVAAICVACFADTDPVTGMCGMGALSLMAVYIGAFHGARLITFYLGISLAALIFQTCALGSQEGVAVAVAKSVVTGALIIGVPPIFHLAQVALTKDAAAAMIDQLTGLHNRRGFNSQATALAAVVGAERADLSIIVIDIDSFKQINDRYGHAVGDQVIATSAGLIRTVTSGLATVGRIGGEEFCVAIASPEQPALETGERIRKELASMDTASAVTASIGVATGQLLAEESPRELLVRLIAEADHAMYSAKRDGGNRVRGRQS